MSDLPEGYELVIPFRETPYIRKKYNYRKKLTSEEEDM
jgi:hypothetical protein